MGKFLKSKSFTISILCIMTVSIGGTLVFANRVKDNKKVVNTTMTKNNTTKNKPNAKGAEKKQIHSTHKIETSWVKDPKEPKNLLEVTKDNSIIKVKVKSLGEPVFLEKTSDFSDPNPFTPVEVIVEETLDGEALTNLKTIYLRGGDVKISELMKTLDQGTIEKIGLNTLTKEKQDTMYISYKSDYDYNLKPNEEYILIVAKNSNNTHTVVGNGYGIFKEDKEMKAKSSSSEVALRNVLTNKELTDKNGIVLRLK